MPGKLYECAQKTAVASATFSSGAEAFRRRDPKNPSKLFGVQMR